MDTLKCYEILETSQEASPAAIRESYVRLIQIWNPERYDHWAMKAKASEMMIEIEEAYRHLSTFIPELKGASLKPVPEKESDHSDALVDDSTSHSHWILTFVVLLLFGFAVMIGTHVSKTEYKPTPTEPIEP